MKLYFSNYRYHWYSPYKIIEKAMFWKKDFDAYENEPPKWLTNICVGIRSVLDFVHPEIKYIKVDPYDSWNADGTLTRIILPLLKQLKEDKAGSPCVDDSDVPDEIKSINAPTVENEWDTDDNFHKRWEWVLNEIIWTFEQLHPDYDWEDEYRSGKIDYQLVKMDNGMSEMVKGPNNTYTCDYEGMKLHQEKINNGLRLFGKYYQNLWS